MLRFGGFNEKLSPLGESKSYLTEVGRADSVLPQCWGHGVETQSREDIPGRGLPIVLVTAVAVGAIRVELIHDPTYPVLGLPRLSRIVIEVDHVLDGLIAMGIVAHIHDLHLSDLMDDEAVVAIIEDGREGEDAVELLSESLVSSHQIDEPLDIMEDRPAVV